MCAYIFEIAHYKFFKGFLLSVLYINSYVNVLFQKNYYILHSIHLYNAISGITFSIIICINIKYKLIIQKNIIPLKCNLTLPFGSENGDHKIFHFKWLKLKWRNKISFTKANSDGVLLWTNNHTISFCI